MKMSRGGETDKLTQKKLSSLHRESTQFFWRGPKFHKKNAIIVVCSFLSQQPNWKAIESARKTQCQLLFQGKWKKKKKKRSQVASFLPTLEAHFYTIVGLCSVPLVAMASERQMPCFHFKTEFPYKQNCFHLRIFSPSHSIRAVFKRTCLLKIWKKIHCILLIREEIYSSFLRTRIYRKIFSK